MSATVSTLEVICEPQEGRSYYATSFTEKIEDKYYTTNPLTYVGRYIGNSIQNREEFCHFINEAGEEVILIHKPRTAFYHIKQIAVVRPSNKVVDAPLALSLPAAISVTELLHRNQDLGSLVQNDLNIT